MSALTALRVAALRLDTMLTNLIDYYDAHLLPEVQAARSNAQEDIQTYASVTGELIIWSRVAEVVPDGFVPLLLTNSLEGGPVYPGHFNSSSCEWIDCNDQLVVPARWALMPIALPADDSIRLHAEGPPNLPQELQTTPPASLRPLKYLMVTSPDSGFLKNEYEDRRFFVVTDQKQQGAMSEGWKLVPIEPDSNMVVAGFEAASEFEDTDEWEDLSGCQRAGKRARICYEAMLAAAPADRPADSNGARVWPEKLTPALRDALGLMNFWTGPVAHLFRAAGDTINRKCEDEQAFVLHWAAGLALEHGEGWRKVAVETIRARAAVPAAAPTDRDSELKP